MKKVILMAAVAMLFVGTAAAQGKVTKTNSGVGTTTTTTVSKPEQGPKGNNNQGKTVSARNDASVKACNKTCNNAKEGKTCCKKNNTGTVKTNTNATPNNTTVNK